MASDNVIRYKIKAKTISTPTNVSRTSRVCAGKRNKGTTPEHPIDNRKMLRI